MTVVVLSIRNDRISGILQIRGCRQGTPPEPCSAIATPAVTHAIKSALAGLWSERLSPIFSLQRYFKTLLQSVSFPSNLTYPNQARHNPIVHLRNDCDCGTCSEFTGDFRAATIISIFQYSNKKACAVPCSFCIHHLSSMT